MMRMMISARRGFVTSRRSAMPWVLWPLVVRMSLRDEMSNYRGKAVVAATLSVKTGGHSRATAMVNGTTAMIVPMITAHRNPAIGNRWLITQSFEFGFAHVASTLRRWRRKRSLYCSSASSSSLARQIAVWQNPILVNELDGRFRAYVGVDGGDGVSGVSVGYQRAPITIFHQRPGMSQDEKTILGSSQGYVHTLFVGQET